VSTPENPVVADALRTVAEDPLARVYAPALVLSPDADGFVDELASRQGEASRVVAYVRTSSGRLVRVEVRNLP
jgi:hypothetical protein